MGDQKVTEVKTSASTQMLGFLFQIERALHWLILSDSEGYVFLEKDDDVSVELIENDTRKYTFEQDKISLRPGNSLSNSSENLWKTLSNWIQLIKSKKLDSSKCSFILSTNSKISDSNCFVKKIDKATSDDESKQVYDLLLNWAKSKYSSNKKLTPTQKKMNPYYKSFLEFNESDCKELIKNISLVENIKIENRATYKDKIRHLLQLPQEISIEAVYDHLIGWITNQAIDAWTNSNTCIIHNEVFYNVKTSFISSYQVKPFIEKAIELLPITSLQRDKHINSLFVKQINLIKASDEEVYEAIDDFLRHKSQITENAREGYINQSDFHQYEIDLFDFWKNKSRQYFRRQDDKISLGYELFADCKFYKGKLKGIEPEQKYTHRGTYHNLANNEKIGWHPEWEAIINNE